MATSIPQLAHALLQRYDHHEALDFIQQFGSSSLAHRLQRMPRTSFTDQRMIKELERIAALGPQAVLSPAPGSPGIPSPSDLTSKRNQIVKKMDYLTGMLDNTPTKSDRLQLGLEILDLEDELRDIWYELDYIEKTGHRLQKPPEDELQKVFDGVETVQALYQIRNNHRSYLSRCEERKGDPAYHTSVIREADQRLKKLEP
jgi:hypothetical protein